MKLLSRSLLFIFLLVLVACTPSQQSSDTKSDQEQEIYVFDDVGISDTTTADVIEEPQNIIEKDSVVETTPSIPVDQFIVQVGAFTSLERAQTFVNENQSKINWKMDITYSEKVQLHVVQLPPFATRSEAEYVRNQLWQTENFKDAFIVP